MDAIKDLLKDWDRLNKRQIKERLITLVLEGKQEPILSVSDMAQELGIAEITVRVKAAKNGIGTKVNPKAWVFRPSDVDLFKAIPSTPGPKPKKPIDD